MKRRRCSLVLALVLWAALAGGCSDALGPPDGDASARAAAPAPVYHLPGAEWRAWHPVRLAEGYFSMEECLACHRGPDSCNRCHGYVGAKEIGGVR